MINRRTFFDQPVKNGLKTFDNIQKIVTGQGDDYLFSKKYCKLIATDLSKQLKLDVDPKAIQHINFTGIIERDGNTQIFFIIEEA